MSNERALYRVLDPSGFFGDDDTLYSLDKDGNPAEIYFDGIPNEQLEPLNDTAHQRLNDYLNMLDDFARIKAEKQGVPFVGRPRTLDGAISIATAEARAEMSIMGNRNKVSTTGLAEPRSVPETGAKRGRGRPPKSVERQANG